MFLFATDTVASDAIALPVPSAPLTFAPMTLAQIMTRVEQRLRWYGFSDWHIRDAVCLGAQVTVEVRSPRGAIAAFTVSRDGGATSYAVIPAAPLLQAVSAPPVREAVVPRLARTFGKRAIGAMGQRAMGAIWPNGRFLSRPALCQG